MKSYILELLRNGMWVFPIIGKAKKIDIAKRPMAFCYLKGKYIEALELLRIAPKELIEKCRDSRGKIKLDKVCYGLGGEKYITWKKEEILTLAEEYARKNHFAWGIWLLESERFGFDIDIYKAQLKNVEHIRQGLIKILKQMDNVYSELSGRGGIHLITYASKDRKLRESSNNLFLSMSNGLNSSKTYTQVFIS